MIVESLTTIKRLLLAGNFVAAIRYIENWIENEKRRG